MKMKKTAFPKTRKKMYLIVAALMVTTPLGADQNVVGSVASEGQAEVKTTSQDQHEERFELIVLFDNVGVGASEREVISHVNSNSKMIPIAGVGRPVSARFAIKGSNRPIGKQPEFADRSAIVSETAEEMLLRYIVLSYPNESAFNAAKRALLKNPNVISVEDNTPYGFSSYTNAYGELIPNDPYAILQDQDNGKYSYQWGLETMNLFKAWNISTGNAYVGIPDAGLPDSHEVLENYRSHMSTVSGTSLPSPLKVHGTHVAGIIASGTDNSKGIAGVCWNCSYTYYVTNTSPDDFANAYSSFANSGMQVINSSFGKDKEKNPKPDICANPDDEYALSCKAIQALKDRDIILVAATGNGDDKGQNEPTKSTGYNLADYPARHNYVIAVGATNGEDNNPVDLNNDPMVFSNYGEALDFLAPGYRVLSAVPNGLSYNVNGNDAGSYIDEDNERWPAWDCGDDGGREGDANNNDNNGYGTCTGTSMAAPHITGLVGLIRTVNPLLTHTDVRKILELSAEGEGFRIDDKHGFGVPDAAKALEIAMGSVNGEVLPNRLTPLFGLYSGFGKDFFYTVVPQMAAAAMHGTMPPRPQVGTDANGDPQYEKIPYLAENGWDSKLISYLYEFPGTSGFYEIERPWAKAYVFTTGRNPLSPGNKLLPLYRFSKQVPTESNENNVDHAYATTRNDPTLSDYYFDGIEGYIYPQQYSGATGVVPLWRGYNSSVDNHGLFINDSVPEGYDEEVTLLGYVYPNQDTDNDHLIDGFERLIGSNPLRADTDFDDVKDGVEFPPDSIADVQNSPIDIGHLESFTVSCEDFGRLCTFKMSDKLQGSDLVYVWDYGDEDTETVTTDEVTHQYPEDGVFTASVTVSDSESSIGLTQSGAVTVKDMSWLVVVTRMMLQ